MKIEKVWTLCFSATGNTDRLVTLLGKELAEGLEVPLKQIAFTKPAEREQVYTFTETDLVVVGSPTYAGKLPNKILPDFREINIMKWLKNTCQKVPVVLFPLN